MKDALRFAKKVIVLVIGLTVVALGVVMLVTPGPATVVIPIGLAILATEFVWARRWLDKLKHKAGEVTRVFRKPESK